MNTEKNWTHILGFYVYAAHFVSEWKKADRSSDFYWQKYEQALNFYLSSRDAERLVAHRYADLMKSKKIFLELRQHGDEHVATQLALLRVYVDLGQTENAIAECDRLIEEISKEKNIQMTRPFLAPLPSDEQRPFDDDWSKWLRLSLENTKKYLSKSHFDAPNRKNKLYRQDKFSEILIDTPQLVLSICIPTFNRAEKLYACLSRLREQIKVFPLSYEIVISDNHSTDNTREVVESFSDLKIRYIRREKNHGGFENSRFALKSGSGKYLCYVADDDSIRLDVVHRILLRMQASLELVACFAPAATYDVKNKKVHSLFGHAKSDVFINKGEQRKLLDYILQTHAYPEIAIYRAQEFNRAFLENSHVAYEAFVWTSEMLDYGDIAFLNEAYYYWHIPEFTFQAEEELNLGHVNAMNDWDRFRGGLDVILSKIIDSLSQAERQYYVLLTHRHAASMLALAIRLRYQHNYGNPNDLYYLSKRLIGMGYKNMLPVELDEIDKKRSNQIQDKKRHCSYTLCLRERAQEAVRQLTQQEELVLDPSGRFAVNKENGSQQIPLVLVNDFPGAGGSYLTQVLQYLFSGDLDIRVTWNKKMNLLRKYGKNIVCFGHYGVDDEFGRVFRSPDSQKEAVCIFLYRDPRDAVLSFENWYVSNNFRKRGTKNFICEAKNKMNDFLFFYNLPGIYKISFEMLAFHPKQSIKKICDMIGYSAPEDWLLDNLFRTHSRITKVGKWRHHFNDEIEEAFKTTFGNICSLTGYESDENWSYKEYIGRDFTEEEYWDFKSRILA